MYTRVIKLRWQSRRTSFKPVKLTSQNRRRKITMSQISKMALVLVLAAASLALTFAFAGCNKSAPNSAQTQPGAAPADQVQDPAASANLAPVAAQPATYDQQAANSNYQQAPSSDYQQQPNSSNNDSRSYSNRDSRSRNSRDSRNPDSRDSANYNDGSYNDPNYNDPNYNNGNS